MTGIYERLGIRPLINARGTHTRLGGSVMPPEVLDAMREAAGAYILLDELQAVASRGDCPRDWRGGGDGRWGSGGGATPRDRRLPRGDGPDQDRATAGQHRHEE